jgi:glycosyltransferase involved in cell wall biosynthesis
MSANPQISIIVPVYNGGRYLAATVSSVLEQLFADFELLIINDGSTDDTAQIALELVTRDPRITYYQKENSGVSDTRNFGLVKAKGEFIVFLDADDIIDPDFLLSRLNFLRENPEIGICGSAVKMIDGDDKLITGLPLIYAPGEDMLMDVLCYKPQVTTIPSNLMHRKQLLVDHHINFDRRLSSSADRLLLCKLALVTKAHCLPVANFNYRVHSVSMYNNPESKSAVFEDNELFVKILIDGHIVHRCIKGIFLKKNYYMLAGAAFKAKLYSRAIIYGVKYFMAKAVYLK